MIKLPRLGAGCTRGLGLEPALGHTSVRSVMPL